MKIAVTGATGFLGKVVVADLIANGHSVVCLSRSHPHFETSPNPDIEWKQVNYLNLEDIKQALSGCDAVAHLAGIAHARPSPDDSRRYHEAICEVTDNLLKAAVEVACPRFVFASTIKVYGESSGDSILDEDSPTFPTTIYGQCKKVAEKIVQDQSHRISTVTLRLPPLYGQGMKGSVRHLFKAARFRLPLPLHGFVQKRQFLFVKNASSLIIAALEGDISRGLYNVFDPRAWTMGEFYKAVYEAIHGQSLPTWLAWSLPKGVEAWLSKFSALSALMNPFELASRRFNEWQPYLNHSQTAALRSAAADSVPALQPKPSPLHT